MSVSKKPNGTWRVIYRYTDWRGERKQTSKRGFKAKRDALAWEREQIRKTESALDMTFASFVEMYAADMKSRLKLNTWLTKEHIIKTKILPFFGDMRMDGISAKDIIRWQNGVMGGKGKNGKPYSATYIKTMHNQVSAIFNHAVRYYDLKSNPAAKAGSVGKKEAKEMLFWTKDEYTKFSDAMMDKPISYYAFEILYWCGLRVGELLALTPSDFDLDKSTVKISKSYQRINGEDIVTDPKTPKSNRVVKMPDFLTEEIREYLKSIYGAASDARIFPISKSYLHHEMDRGSKATGVKRIRVHDIRHSHVSLLIEMGFSAVAIADRVGHESIDITYRYAHLFPSRQTEIADKLDSEKENY
ncbi:MAG: site-specific integrase [Clostridiales Family XIII bacterium]|nr:site-specific integrase [Clostridiales Family XIII bacterium]